MDHLANIQRAIDSIEARLRQPLSIAQLAKAAGLSFWHFQRTFAAVVGEPVGFYIRRRRLTQAAEDLRVSRRRILDVALDYQFESHESFTRAFKSVFHLNPGEVRRRRDLIWSQARPQLTLKKLRHLARHAAMDPVILSLPAFTLIGPEAHFISALSPDANNLKIIPPLWRMLTSRRVELPKPLDSFSYGACRCLPPGKRSRDDELEYLAGVSLDPQTKPPAGMGRWKIPAGTYARFIHHGSIATLSETISYAYGSWLPRSEFELAEAGVELERYDERFCEGRPDSELDYLAPIRPRQR